MEAVQVNKSTPDHRFISSLNGRCIEGGLLSFTKSSCVTVEAFTDDAETMEEYRAHWMELGDGEIQITRIERNDARPGKPDYWIVDVMSRREVVALEKMIAAQLKRERPRSEAVESMGKTEFWGVVA